MERSGSRFSKQKIDIVLFHLKLARSSKQCHVRASEHLAKQLSSKQLSVLFLIPLISKQRATNWQLTCDLLDQTLRTLLNQVDANWQAVVACHDVPQNVLEDPRISFVRLSYDTATIHPQNDKAMKLVHAQLAAAKGWEFCMGLDADDLVHCHLVEFLNNKAAGDAWQINQGYQYDFPSKRIMEYDKLGEICGSSVIVSEKVSPTPISGDDLAVKSSFWWNCGHKNFREKLALDGIECQGIPFPCLMYTVNQQSDWQKIYRKRWLAEQAKRIVKFYIIGRKASRQMKFDFGIPEIERV